MLLASSCAWAQKAPAGDPLGRGNPRSTVTEFLQACGRKNYPLAAQYLDLSRLPARTRTQKGIELAQGLEAILNQSRFSVLQRALLRDPAAVPNLDLQRRLGQQVAVPVGLWAGARAHDPMPRMGSPTRSSRSPGDEGAAGSQDGPVLPATPPSGVGASAVEGHRSIKKNRFLSGRWPERRPSHHRPRAASRLLQESPGEARVANAYGHVRLN